jgi:LacI family transcriptional regulator
VKAFEEAGLKFKAVRDAHLPGNAASGYAYGKEIFARAEHPDVVIASDGAMPGLFRAAYEAGLRIPQDVSFVGIDGVAAMEFLWPPLTTVDTHIRSLGTQAVKALTEMILSGERKRGVEITPVTLVNRASARI